MFKSIEYTLPATFLSTAQCRTINTQLHKTMLPKMSIDVQLPLAYQYSLSRYQGLGSLNTERTQFIKKLKIFIKHISSTSQLGLSFQTNIESHHLLLDSNQTMFSLDFDKYGFLNVSGWITHLWEMLHKYNIQMRGEYNHTQPA